VNEGAYCFNCDRGQIAQAVLVPVHAIEVSRLDHLGDRINQIVYGCHPTELTIPGSIHTAS
jgi:hypothetical protein